MVLWSNILSLDFLSVSHRVQWKNKNAVYRLQITALAPEIFKFGKKWVKYPNEMSDDVIHPTQYYIKYINRATLDNLQCRPLKLGWLIILQEIHPCYKKSVPMTTPSFPVPTHFSAWKMLNKATKTQNRASILIYLLDHGFKALLAKIKIECQR